MHALVAKIGQQCLVQGFWHVLLDYFITRTSINQNMQVGSDFSDFNRMYIIAVSCGYDT